MEVVSSTMLDPRKLPEMLIKKFGKDPCIEKEGGDVSNVSEHRLIIAQGPENTLLRVEASNEFWYGINFEVHQPKEVEKVLERCLLAVRVSKEICGSNGDHDIYEDRLSVRGRKHSLRLGVCPRQDGIAIFLSKVERYVLEKLKFPGFKFAQYQVKKRQVNTNAKVLIG